MSAPSASDTSSESQPLTVAAVGDLLQSGQCPIGIDKLDLWTETAPFLSASPDWDESAVVHDEISGYRYRANLIGPEDLDVFAQLHDRGPDVPPTMQIRFNPSHGRPLIDVAKTRKLAEEVWKETELLVSYFHGVDSARIIRVDIAADVAPIDDMAAVFRALRLAKPRKGWTRAAYDNPGRRGGASVIHKTKYAGQVIAYDKSAEAQLATPTLRIEAKIFKKARKQHGIETVRDLTEDSARKAFNYLAEPFIDHLVQAGGLPDTSRLEVRPRQAVEAIGALYLRENGLEDLFPLSRERRRTLDKVIRDLGIVSVGDLTRPTRPSCSTAEIPEPTPGASAGS